MVNAQSAMNRSQAPERTWAKAQTSSIERRPQIDMNNTQISPGPPDLKLREAVQSAVGRMDDWLGRFGETSQDLYDFYATKYGQLAKRIYYRRPLAGTVCVAPLVFMEAFAPAMRGWFWPKTRFP